MLSILPQCRLTAEHRHDGDDAQLIGGADEVRIQVERVDGVDGNGRSYDDRVDERGSAPLRHRPRHRTQFVQQLIPESREDVEGLCRRDPDRARAARRMQRETMASTPTMRANAARPIQAEVMAGPQAAAPTPLARLASGAAPCCRNADSIRASASAWANSGRLDCLFRDAVAAAAFRTAAA
jgi:hypothetical protein